MDCDTARSDQVSAFLASGTPASSNRVFLYCTLASFYRYAITRSLVTRSPLPVVAPKAPPSAPPYIYSRDELRRVLDAVKTYRKRVNQLEPHTFHAHNVGVPIPVAETAGRGGPNRVRHRESSPWHTQDLGGRSRQSIALPVSFMSSMQSRMDAPYSFQR